MSGRFLGCVLGTTARENERRSEEALRQFEDKLDGRIADGLEEIAKLIRQERRERREDGDREVH
jgi:hypothetical protein